MHLIFTLERDTMSVTKWLLVGGLLLCGCGEAEKPQDKGNLKGTVTLDGKPLATGRISFIDENSQPRREYLSAIENGEFQCHAPPREMRVEIRSFKMPPNPSIDDPPYPQILPARYNDESELTADLKTGKPVSFKLTSGEDK